MASRKQLRRILQREAKANSTPAQTPEELADVDARDDLAERRLAADGQRPGDPI